jgi:hypothetical protein
MQYFYIIYLIFFLIWYKAFGKKKNFNKLETFWIFLVILFYKIFFASSVRIKVILLCVILFSNRLRAAFIFVSMLPLIICGGRYSLLRMSNQFVFHNCLGLEIDYSLLPKYPTIFVSNYPSNYVEYTANTLLAPKMCLLLWGDAIKIVKLIYGKDNLIGVNKGEFDKIQDIVMSKMKEGYSIFAYIEKDYTMRKSIYNIDSLRTGMFTIAKNLGVTITPVVFDHFEHSLGIVNNNVYKIFVDKTRIVTDVDEEVLKVSNLFKRKLGHFKIK